MLGLSAWSCGTDVYFGDLAQGGRGGNDSSQAGMAPVGSAGQASCTGDKGPASINLGTYCMDATEVSQADYSQFLADSPQIADQPAECAWNDHFEPQDLLPSEEITPLIAENANLPVVNIDFCDARAYCAWAGKRLCGKIGGGALPADDPNNGAQSEWYRACSAGGTLVYPYGEDFDAEACAVSAGPHEVGQQSTCEGGYPGLFDLIGNVWEWEDSCAGDPAAPETMICSRRGGAITVMPEEWTCEDRGDPSPRRTRQVDIGIRCCSDVLQ